MDNEVRTANLTLLLSSSSPLATCAIFGKGTDWQSTPTPLKVTLTGLSKKIDELRMVLTEKHTRIWASIDQPLGAATNPVVADEFDNAVKRVVSQGAALYHELKQIGLGPILDKIESTLEDGDRITIQTDSAFLPWEILYPLEYNIDWPRSKKEQKPVQRNRLWGYRFMTSHILLPDDSTGWKPPLNEHANGAAFISLNLNKTIEKAFEKRNFKPIDFHKQFYSTRLVDSGQLLDDPEAIKELLLAPDNQATIIYLYCHGRSATLFDANGDSLELGGSSITPAFFDYNEIKYKRGPIVILNSCSSAATSPLSFSSFHKKFRSKRAMGMIGTTIAIPATFAAAFGKSLIEAYLDHVPVGKAIYLLRKKLLDQSNPLGLFYSLQCPLYVTAPEEPH